jgi:hypothetical protein
MLARLKLAAGLMWMNGRTDKVSEDDWGPSALGLIVRPARAWRA